MVTVSTAGICRCLTDLVETLLDLSVLGSEELCACSGLLGSMYIPCVVDYRGVVASGSGNEQKDP